MALLRYLDQHKDEFGNVNDGMDISILSFENDKTFFSAAKNPLVLVRQDEIHLIKGSKFAIGGFGIEHSQKSFELHELDSQNGDKYYLFSDGFQDQFGGPKSKKYMTRRFRETILETSQNGLEAQKTKLDNIFSEWKGNLQQTDDVLIVGIEL